LRNGQFKLIQFTSGAEEFYDLLSDPYEQTNLLRSSISGAPLVNYYSLVMRLGLYQTTLAAPQITSFHREGPAFTVTLPRTTNTYDLWRTDALGELGWAPVANAIRVTNGTSVNLTDSNATNTAGFYRVEAR
jgi:hypothetical protein